MDLFWLLFLLYPLIIKAESSCDAENGVCVNNEMAQQLPSCEIIRPSTRGDIYSHGGSAQAYKPNQPEKKEICDPTIYESWRYRIATWPFSKSSRRSPPTITLSLRPWNCDTKKAGDSGCCQLMSSTIYSDSELVVEIWQTRPDGTYSSLRSGQQDGDCRARQQLDDTTLTFTTVAPGSTGILGGLGPYGFDFAPYGPPVIHIFISHAEIIIEPLIINLPIVIQATTLESTTFGGSDWRGAAWMQSKPDALPYNVTSWEANVTENTINIKLDVFLHVKEKAEKEMSLHNRLCRSWVYGLPYSFFVEPISICAPSVLDFFAL